MTDATGLAAARVLNLMDHTRCHLVIVGDGPALKEMITSALPVEA